MKIRISLLVLILATSAHGQAQKLRTLYYSNYWELTTKDSATYYRVCQIDTVSNKFIGEVKDFNSSGQLLMTGTYQTGLKNGLFTFYYSSGQIESQGEFKKNLRYGVWKYFYPNGKLLREVRFSDDESFFVISAFDPDENQIIEDGTGPWIYSYDWYKVPQTLIVKGSFVDGKKEGEWICSQADGQLIYQETFKKGVFKKGFLENKREYTTEFPNKFLPHFKHEVTEQGLYQKGVTINDYPFLTFLPKPKTVLKTDSANSVNSHEKTFLIVEQPPEYEGGMDALYKFIKKNLSYKGSFHGKVFVAFIVTADGSISEAQIVKGICAACDKAALDVVNKMPNWRPGTQQGKPVRVKFVLPISL